MITGGFGVWATSPWNLDELAEPWNPGRSIYSHVLAHLRPDGAGLLEGGDPLPDDDLIRGSTGMGWAPGARDGVFGGGITPEESSEVAARVLDALAALTEEATDERAQALYQLLTAHSALGYIDALLERISNAATIPPDRLLAVARWLATGSPDREPVKAAIALLGLIRGGGDRDLLLTLGRHEEFTLYAAVALQNMEADPEAWLWELAKMVLGWGRIYLVDRLAETEHEGIKAWLLREGYRNNILIEYTALTCARTGGLLRAMQESEPDHRLLKGAGAILKALIQGQGGPAEGIEAYSEGAAVAELYLHHLQARDLDLEVLNVVTTIEQFLVEPSASTEGAANGWEPHKSTILGLIQAIQSRPGWEEKIAAGLASEDYQEFWDATRAAEARKIDTWEVHYGRLQRGEDQWYAVTQTDDPGRMDAVLRLAEERLPLEEIASGPAEESGLGAEYRPHVALDFILQALRSFPGKGWPLIRAGLQSPVIRNRNMAVRALATWRSRDWPGEAEALLLRAIELEPYADTQALMREVLVNKG